MEKLYTLRETDELTGIGVFYIKRAMKEGLVKYKKVKGEILISKTEIDLWLNKSPELIDRLRKNKERFYFKKKDEYHKLKFILPFNGTWLVGGEHLNFCTRYAWDFIKIDEKDYAKVYPGMPDEEKIKLKIRSKGWNNPQSFLSFNLEIITPANGLIYQTSDPKEFKKENEFDQGIIIIKHAENIYSRLCHVLGKSILVKQGDQVKEGDLLCLSGGKHGDGINQIPHLHWDIWDHPHFLFAKGIPMKIKRGYIFNDGKYYKRYNFYLKDGILATNRIED